MRDTKLLICCCEDCKYNKKDPQSIFRYCDNPCIGISYKGTCLNYEAVKKEEREHENT